jgi:thymidylate synthase
MNKLDKQYQQLLQDIIDYGVEKKDRTGTGTKSIFGYTIRHKMSDGFPLLTTKKMAWKTMVTELLWFLRGDTNIKFLVENGCHIWDGDAYKNYMQQYNVVDAEEYSKGYEDQCWGYPVLDHVKPTTASYKRGQINAYLEGKADKPFFYLTQEEFINKIKTDNEFAKMWGELGPIYGKQWRSWETFTYDDYANRPKWVKDDPIDQITNLINELKTNPDSRRLMVNAWNVSELNEMVLPPCHYGFQVYTRELSREERKEILYGRFRKGPIILNGKSYRECAPTDINFEFFNIPTRAISLMWNQRSVDTFLGLPFNIASYGLLLEIIAKEVNMVPDQLIGNLGDTHLYLNHIEQAKEQIGKQYTPEERSQMLKEAMGYENYHNAIEELMPFGGGLSEYYDFHKIPKHTREPFPLPTLRINTEFWKTESGECGAGPFNTNLQGFEIDDFQLENYVSHPAIKAPLSN